MGHHFIPQQVYNNYDLPKEAYSVFKNATTDPVEHYFDKGHRAYNAEAQKFFDQFLKDKNIDPTKMTSEQAQQCLDEFKQSDQPSIKDYLEFLKRGGGRFRSPLIICPLCIILENHNPDYGS